MSSRRAHARLIRLLAAGTDLDTALQRLDQDMDGRRLGAAAALKHLRDGASLAELPARCPTLLSGQAGAVLRAGAMIEDAGGSLADAARAIERHRADASWVLYRIGVALIYPAFMIGVLVSALLLTDPVGVPELAWHSGDLITDAGVVQTHTQASSEPMTPRSAVRVGVFGLAALASLLIAALLIARTPSRAGRIAHKVVHKLPWLGAALTDARRGVVAGVIADLTRAGMPPEHATQAALTMLATPLAAAESRAIAAALADGEPLAQALRASQVLSPSIRTAITDDPAATARAMDVIATAQRHHLRADIHRFEAGTRVIGIGVIAALIICYAFGWGLG